MKLRPCPFCGGEAKVETISFFGFFRAYWVTCTQCCTETGGNDKDAIKAINFWNTRIESEAEVTGDEDREWEAKEE